MCTEVECQYSASEHIAVCFFICFTLNISFFVFNIIFVCKLLLMKVAYDHVFTITICKYPVTEVLVHSSCSSAFEEKSFSSLILSQLMWYMTRLYVCAECLLAIYVKYTTGSKSCYFRPCVTTYTGFVKYLLQYNLQYILTSTVMLYPDAAFVCNWIEILHMALC